MQSARIFCDVYEKNKSKKYNEIITGSNPVLATKIKVMKQFFKQIFNKKIMKDRKVKLVHPKCGEPSSNNPNLGNGKVFTIIAPHNVDKSWLIKSEENVPAGWVYEWEMDTVKIGIKELEEELSETQTKLNTIKSKIDWINETGVTEFLEDEFKVYQTLKLIENGNLSIIEKSKLIVELIKK